MNTSMNKPVFIITRIIHQATSYKLLDKVSERYKPVSFIKPGFVIGSMKILIAGMKYLVSKYILAVQDQL